MLDSEGVLGTLKTEGCGGWTEGRTRPRPLEDPLGSSCPTPRPPAHTDLLLGGWVQTGDCSERGDTGRSRGNGTRSRVRTSPPPSATPAPTPVREVRRGRGRWSRGPRTIYYFPDTDLRSKSHPRRGKGSLGSGRRRGGVVKTRILPIRRFPSSTPSLFRQGGEVPCLGPRRARRGLGLRCGDSSPPLPPCVSGKGVWDKGGPWSVPGVLFLSGVSYRLPGHVRLPTPPPSPGEGPPSP